MFHYYNINPKGYHIPDCVVRAISTATGMSYYDVVYKLKLNSTMYMCEELNVRCYEKLLDFDFDLPHYVGNGNTACEVAEDFKDNILILRMEGHLSCSLFGDVWDIWDCSEEIVTDFWIVC